MKEKQHQKNVQLVVLELKSLFYKKKEKEI